MQSKRTRIAAIRRRLPNLEQILEQARLNAAKGGAVGIVNQKLVENLTNDRARLFADLAELTAEDSEPKSS